MRISSLLSAVCFAASLLALSPIARAASEAAFTQQAFAAAEAAGKPILVEITASWCPTCAKQRPILSQLFNTPDFAGLQVFNVDFDSQKDVVRAMGARMQSTLIVFKGNVEQGRSVGVTDPAAIHDLLAKVKS